MSLQAVLVDRLLARLRQVRDLLGLEHLDADAETRFADALDSMCFVEFLTLVAEDSGVSVEAVEEAAGRHYGSVGELAAALDAAGLPLDQKRSPLSATSRERASDARPMAWLAATAARLPVRRQPASEINAALRRPPGWLEEHAGIEARCLWGEEDPLSAAASAAQECLQEAGLSPDALGALLVTSEAPPLLTGLAAALHMRMGLASSTAALEIGGACTGFLAALWTASRLLVDTAAVLMIAIEAPSRWLSLVPSAAGEAAALFGDGAAACLLTAQPPSRSALPLRDILLGTDGSAGSLLRSEYEPGSGVLLHMEGVPLAHRAVRAMADA
ncbi:MAG TPA: hypothetical protein VMG10_17525, partial [Gemmataceae bacterium]|nr:hypothetical protein [Gemmataceae bacterium]